MAFQTSTNAWRRIRPRITQWESVTGRKVPPSLIRQWLEAELSVEAGKAIQSRALDIQQEGLELQREQIESAAGAAKIAGIGELAVGGAALAPAIGKGLKTIGTQLGITGGATAAGAATLPVTIPGGAVVDPLLLNLPTPAISATTAGAATTTATTTAGTALTLPTAIGAGAIGAGAGFLGRLITGAGEEGHRGGERITSAGIGAGGGALGGFLVGGPIGAVIGGIVGLVSGGK